MFLAGDGARRWAESNGGVAVVAPTALVSEEAHRTWTRHMRVLREEEAAAASAAPAARRAKRPRAEPAVPSVGDDEDGSALNDTVGAVVCTGTRIAAGPRQLTHGGNGGAPAPCACSVSLPSSPPHEEELQLIPL